MIEPILVAEEPELKDARVLIIDDSEDIRELVEAHLKLAGATAETVESATAGIDLALTEKFDVVLMDIEMPVMDGHQALATLRARGYEKPIVAITASAECDRQTCLHEGFDDFLSKPIEWPALIRRTQELMRRY